MSNRGGGGPSTRTAGVVLAAGRGRRFGGTKQLAPVAGRPLVRHAVDTALAAGLDPVLVVVGHDAGRVRDALPPDVEVVDNPRFAEGQASSLRAGVAAAEPHDVHALVVLLGDQPGVTVASIHAVLAAHRDGARIARAAYADLPGHPVLFDRAVWHELIRVTGDEGARRILEHAVVRDVPVPGPRPPDVDRPTDLPPPSP